MMSKKRPLHQEPGVDPFILKVLEEHIAAGGEGVFTTPAVASGSKYPPIDNIAITQIFKQKHPFQLKRMKDDALASQIKRVYDVLLKKFENKKLSPAKVENHEEPNKKQNTSKSVFDDDGDSELDEEVALPIKPDTDKSNSNLRKMYNKNALSYEDKLKKYEEVVENNIPPSLLKKAQKMIARKQEIAGNVNPNSSKSRAAAISSTTKPVVSKPTLTLDDVGGIEGILQDIRELVEYPLTHPEIYSHLGVEPPRGILLHGPPGCGKTMLAHAIAGELQVPFIKVSAPEVVSGMSGESESKIRGLFSDALAQAPCILFIDEIDAIAPKREDAQREMEKRIVAQLLTCMDSLSQANVSMEDNSEIQMDRADLTSAIEDSINNTTGNKQPSVAEMALRQGDNVNTQYTNSTDRENEAAGRPVNKTVIVIAATNRPDSIDSALRRAGRFDREIALGIPDEDSRCRILQTMCRKMRIDPTCDFKRLTKKTVGYVGADLNALTREAAVVAVNRIFTEISSNEVNSTEAMSLVGDLLTNNDEDTSMTDDSHIPSPNSTHIRDTSLTKNEKKNLEIEARSASSRKLRELGGPLSAQQLESLFILETDFEEAIKKVQPSAKREGFATVPDVTWQDVGALDDLEAELDMAIVQPIIDPKLFESIGLSVPAGVLLFGPPGCGKTLVAKAVANQSGASFLSVKGPELLNQYVGQSELAVRQVFQRARTSSPCVIFFDELDALCPKRGNSNNQVTERVVNQLLTELDGMDDRRSVFVIAATNRPDIIDPAMLRPGRLDKLLYISLPDAEGRLQILKKHVRRSPLGDDVNLEVICKDSRTEGFSGADMSALVREATVQALREVQAERAILRKELVARGEDLSNLPSVSIVVNHRHFEFAFSKVRASVSDESRRRYDRMQQKLCQARSTLEPEATEATAPTQISTPSI